MTQSEFKLLFADQVMKCEETLQNKRKEYTGDNQDRLSNPTSELLDLSNELSSETAGVYTEIGLQLGVLLVLDVVTNLRCEKDLKRCNMTMGNENENLISKFYKMQEATYLQETLMKDKEYQKAEHDIIESTKKLKTVLSYDGDSDRNHIFLLLPQIYYTTHPVSPHNPSYPRLVPAQTAENLQRFVLLLSRIFYVYMA